MNDLVYNLLFVAVGALCSWLITHVYYRKSLNNQDEEHLKEKTALVKAIATKTEVDKTILMQNHTDKAIKEWKLKGTAIHYLDSLSHLSKKEKSSILEAAALRYKGQRPRNNPYLSGPHNE